MKSLIRNTLILFLLVFLLCTRIDCACTSTSCNNGGKCDVFTNTCNCGNYFTGPTCDESSTISATVDVVSKINSAFEIITDGSDADGLKSLAKFSGAVKNLGAIGQVAGFLLDCFFPPPDPIDDLRKDMVAQFDVVNQKLDLIYERVNEISQQIVSSVDKLSDEILSSKLFIISNTNVISVIDRLIDMIELIDNLNTYSNVTSIYSAARFKTECGNGNIIQNQLNLILRIARGSSIYDSLDKSLIYNVMVVSKFTDYELLHFWHTYLLQNAVNLVFYGKMCDCARGLSANEQQDSLDMMISTLNKIVANFQNQIIDIYTKKNLGNVQGCYVDNSADRELIEFTETSTQMEVATCNYHCAIRNYPFAAVQNGNKCGCGYTFGKYGVVNLSECNKQCLGDGISQQYCGGVDRNLVYRTFYTYEEKFGRFWGCYKDQTVRDMDGAYLNLPNMNLGICFNNCIDKKFRYAGLQAGNECYCGNTFGKYGTATNCDMACRGNNKQNCGGSMANSLYELYPSISPLMKKTFTPKTCAIDTPARTLKGAYFQDGIGMTVEKCVSFCDYRKSIAVGIQVGSECYCVNGTELVTYADISSCTSRCSGNSLQMCGGPWRNNIYQTIGDLPSLIRNTG